MIKSLYEYKPPKINDETTISPERIENLERQIERIDNEKANFITIAGIFISIFTFISIDVQMFRYICDFKKIVSFILIFAGVLMLFNLSLDYLAKTWISENKKNSKLRLENSNMILGISLILITTGLLIGASSSNPWHCSLYTQPTIIK